MNSHVTKTVDEILKIFHPNKLMQLYDDFVRLYETWNTDAEQDAELQKHCDAELDLLRLIRTAYALSILAENHARDLRKLIDRHPKFYAICESITKQSDNHDSTTT